MFSKFFDSISRHGSPAQTPHPLAPAPLPALAPPPAALPSAPLLSPRRKKARPFDVNNFAGMNPKSGVKNNFTGATPAGKVDVNNFSGMNPKKWRNNFPGDN
ncbi:unnamed protein product [Parascedosporium putredinis]|uniref:Uncharacterized protein n=1 Tax=Parascedosporium putredinis TaxID=1442378 RepID=A0A9P1H8V2_9PEZI|nr:unnamed protein product [Parascedosporium putredinis]CAI7999766.1 unnamed protein product [Parascedosporium putredinis]